MRHGVDVWRSSFLSPFLSSLCRVINKKMYVLSWRTVYFGVNFPRCFATLDINTKIILSWALKQFFKRVQTLFSMFPLATIMKWADMLHIYKFSVETGVHKWITSMNDSYVMLDVWDVIEHLDNNAIVLIDASPKIVATTACVWLMCIVFNGIIFSLKHSW